MPTLQLIMIDRSDVENSRNKNASIEITDSLQDIHSFSVHSEISSELEFSNGLMDMQAHPAEMFETIIKNCHDEEESSPKQAESQTTLQYKDQSELHCAELTASQNNSKDESSWSDILNLMNEIGSNLKMKKF